MFGIKKITIGVFIFLVLIFVFILSVNRFRIEGISGLVSAISPQLTVKPCQDSDGGSFPDIAGTVTLPILKLGAKDFKIYSDSCISSSTKVREYYCDAGKAAYRDHACELGCESGKCKILAVNHFDWRNYSGKNYLTAVKTQKAQDCAYFSILGALEAEARAFYNNPSINMDMSEAYFEGCSMKGWLPGDIDEAKNYIVKNSIPSEQFFPYYDSSGNKIIYNNINCQKNKSEWIKTAWGVKSFIPVKNSEESIKNALIKYGPLVAAMKTCNYFGEFKGTFYDCDAARATGNHAVVIVGFGTEGGKTYWICKNSFGGNWGDGGYFKIFSGRADIGYITYAISEPTFATAINKLCEDADGDGFCNWGLGAKPKAGCPVCNETLKDCDDTDKNVGSCYN